MMVMLGVFGSQYDPGTVTVISNLLQSHERDVGIAVWVTVNSLAGWVTAPLLGVLADKAGLSAVFILSAGVGLAVVAALVLSGRRVARRPDAPDELVEMFG
jgi:MFS family permease